MRYLLFGDSIGAGVGDFENGGWATQLRLYIDRQKKTKDHTLTNLSIGGDTTRGLLKRMEGEARLRMRDFPPKDFTFLIAIGTNDSRTNRVQPSSDISPEEFEKNLHKLIEIASKLSHEVILIGLVPVDESLTTPYKESKFYTIEQMEIYNNIIKRIAQEQHLRVVDLFTDWISADRTKLFTDGLHPNTEGHKIMFEKIRDAIYSS